MVLFSHYDERMDLLVTRHGGHFDGAEAQKRFVKYLQQSGRLPQYWIIDTREVASATFTDSDIAYMGNTERALAKANGGEYWLKMVIIAHPEEDHPINQRMIKMQSNVEVAVSPGQTTVCGLVSDWAEALAALGLPVSTEQLY